jgi:hypothetical protein
MGEGRQLAVGGPPELGPTLFISRADHVKLNALHVDIWRNRRRRNPARSAQTLYFCKAQYMPTIAITMAEAEKTQ